MTETGAVNTIAFVQNGEALATTVGDNRLLVWDLSSGLPQDPPLAGHRSQVLDLAYDPNTQTLVSGDGEGRVFVWRFDTPNRLATPLSGHTDQVYTTAFSPDGTQLASGGKDGTVRLWNLSDQTSQVLGSHDPSVQSVAFSPDGALLASGGTDDIKLWQLQPEPRLLTTLTGPGADSSRRPGVFSRRQAARQRGQIGRRDLFVERDGNITAVPATGNRFARPHRFGVYPRRQDALRWQQPGPGNGPRCQQRRRGTIIPQ